jgi:hypothetical protein
MKTAMQELNEELEIDFKKNTRLRLKIESFKTALEKEKEQIINAFKAGMDYAEYSVPPNFSNEWDEYYNQTYLDNKS